MHREADETVAVRPPGNESGITLPFSLHTRQLSPQMPADAAEQFVTDHAANQRLPLTRLYDDSSETQPSSPSALLRQQRGKILAH